MTTIVRGDLEEQLRNTRTTVAQFEALERYVELIGERNFLRSAARRLHMEGDIDAAEIAIRVDKRIAREDRREIAKRYAKE